MRFHRAFSMITLAQREGLAAIARPETVTSVRLEPILRQGKSLAMVEIRFAEGDAAAVVPFVFVDVAMLLDPERDVLVWPESVADALTDAQATAIAGAIVPWITGEALGRPLNDERVYHCGTFAERELFEAARNRDAIGAAHSNRSLLAAAPFVFAERFRLGRNLGIGGSQAALGFALSSSDMENIAVADDVAADDVLWRWYGVRARAQTNTRDLIVESATHPASFSTGVASEAIRIVVRVDAGGEIPLIVPAPTDAVFPFDRNDGPLLGSLDVVGAIPKTPPARRRHEQRENRGTSSGRIYFAVRDARIPYDDADIDEAVALAEALRHEGFDVEIGDDPARITTGNFDLVHIHGLLDAPLARAFLTVAKANGVPVALHAHAEEASLGGWWGTVVTRYCFEYAADQRSIDDFTALLRQRRLALGDIGADRPYAPPQGDEAAIRDVMRGADVVFVSGDFEAAYVAEKYGRRSNVVTVPPAVSTDSAGIPIGSLIGTANYAFMHGPIGARGNQIIAMRAAEQADIPLIVAGRVEDASYLALLREFGGSKTRIITDPTMPVLATLYAGATVFADLAWVGAGRSRAARAAIGGARLVLADRRPLDPILSGEGVVRVDPGDEARTVSALGDAWYAATEGRFESPIGFHVYENTRPFSVAAAVASGYALLANSSSGSHANV